MFMLSLLYPSMALAAELGEEEDLENIMQRPLAGHQLPEGLQRPGHANLSRPESRLQASAAGMAPLRPPRRGTGRRQDQPEICTPARSSQPAPALPGPSLQLASLDAFTPPDARTLIRPSAPHMPAHMQEECAGGSRYLVRQHADTLAVPPSLPPAATVLAPLPEHGAAHDEFHMQSYLISHQYLASRGLLAVVGPNHRSNI